MKRTENTISDRVRNLYCQEIGQRMTTARKARGLTRKDMAQAISNRSKTGSKEDGISAEVIKQWEHGINRIRVELIPLICEVLHVDAGYLFGEYPQYRREVADGVGSTGLSEEAIENIHKVFLSDKNTSGYLPDAMNRLISSPLFMTVIRSMAYFKRKAEEVWAFAIPGRYSECFSPPDAEMIGFEETVNRFDAAEFALTRAFQDLVENCYKTSNVRSAIPKIEEKIAQYEKRFERNIESYLANITEDQPDDDLKEELRSAMWGDATSSSTDTEPQ